MRGGQGDKADKEQNRMYEMQFHINLESIESIYEIQSRNKVRMATFAFLFDSANNCSIHYNVSCSSRSTGTTNSNSDFMITCKIYILHSTFFSVLCNRSCYSYYFRNVSVCSNLSWAGIFLRLDLSNFDWQSTHTQLIFCAQCSFFGIKQSTRLKLEIFLENERNNSTTKSMRNAKSEFQLKENIQKERERKSNTW